VIVVVNTLLARASKENVVNIETQIKA
jgi:hypothetical protein